MYEVPSFDILLSTEGYAVSGDEDEVKSYLTSNADLVDFLLRVVDTIRSKPLVSAVALELHSDPEEFWEQFFIIVNMSGGNAEDQKSLEDELNSTVLEPAEELLQGRVVFSVER